MGHGKGFIRKGVWVMPRELIDLSGEVHGETQAAYRFFDGTRYAWLPKSQCEWDADERIMTMPEWLAAEKELI